MPSAFQGENVEDVLASIRRIVAEENGVPLVQKGSVVRLEQEVVPTQTPEAAETPDAVYTPDAVQTPDAGPPAAEPAREDRPPESPVFTRNSPDPQDTPDAAGADTAERSGTDAGGDAETGFSAPLSLTATMAAAAAPEATLPWAGSRDAARAETPAPAARELSEDERRLAVFMEVRRRYEERVAERKARARDEDAGDPGLCKLLLTEDFQVREPEPDRIAHPAAPAARVGYREDSDLSDEDEEMEKPTLESVVREAVADSVRAALHGTVMEEQDDMLDDDGFIDAETLRALVISIVHEELRGELGSQISARVRKLVRQEINRALQLQDLGYR